MVESFRVIANLTRNLIEQGLKVDLVLNFLGFHPLLSEFPPEGKETAENRLGSRRF